MFVILRTSSLQKTSGTLLLSNQLLIFFRVVINRTLTHTQPHSPTPTYNQSKKGHTHPHSPNPRKEMVTFTHIQPAKGHTHPQPHTPSQENVILTHTRPHSAKKR